MADDPAELLRAAREARGLSQAELAKLAKTAQVQISRWENGERSPSVKNLARVLGALGFRLELAATPQSQARARARETTEAFNQAVGKKRGRR